MAEEKEGFTVRVALGEGYRADVSFGDASDTRLVMDEAAPMGEDGGPSASRLLAAAVGNCMAASLAFCLRKARVPLEGIDVEVHGSTHRNDKGRLRLGPLEVKLHPRLGASPADIRRCLEIFEN